MTQTIPTDKYGQAYCGPRTVAQAREIVQFIKEQGVECDDTLELINTQILQRLRWIANAGYTGVASVVAKEYGVAL